MTEKNAGLDYKFDVNGTVNKNVLFIFNINWHVVSVIPHCMCLPG